MLRRGLLGLAILAFGSAALLEADEIIIKGKEKDPPLKGKIAKESPKEITLTTKTSVAAEDIVDIVYEIKSATGDSAVGTNIPYQAAAKSEKDSLDPTKEADRKKNLAAAIAKYEEARDVKANIDPTHKRHIEYKILMLRIRQMNEDGATDDKMIAKLTDFAKKNGTGWQIANVYQTLGRMQADAGQLDGAEDSYLKLSKIPGLSDESRHEATLLAIQAKIQGGKFDDARSDIAALQGDLPKGSRFLARAQVAEAECLVAESKKLGKEDAKRAKLFTQAVDLVKGVIKESGDKYVKAVGHNTLGYVYVEQGQLDEGKWEFLWVELVYNQDRVQHAKALYHLWDIFTKLGDAPKAQDCRESLLQPQFAGTEYQRLVQKEAKAP